MVMINFEYEHAHAHSCNQICVYIYQENIVKSAEGLFEGQKETVSKLIKIINKRDIMYWVENME